MGVIWTADQRIVRPTRPVGPNPKWKNKLRALYDFQPGFWKLDQSRGRLGATEVGAGAIFTKEGLQTTGTANSGVKLAHSITSFSDPLTFVVGSRWVSSIGVDWSLLDDTSGTWTGFYGSSSAGANVVLSTLSNSFDGSLSVAASSDLPSNYVVSFRGVNDGYAVGLNRNSATDTAVTPPTSFSNSQVSLGWSARGGADDNPVIVLFSHFAILQGRLTNQEIQDLAANPWQLWAPDQYTILFDSPAGGANTTGTLNSTLDAATLAGVGSVTRSGTLAVTLDAATLVGIGGVATSSTLAVTLDAATLTGIGAVTTGGTLSSTLEDATLAGVGSVAVGTNRDGTLAVTLDAATLAGIGSVTTSGTLAVTLDNATLAGIGTAGQAVTGTLVVALDNVTLSGVGAIPVAPSQGGGTGTGRNLSRKQKKKLKAVESQEWLKAEETARQLLSDRFTKQTPKEKAEALQTYVESLQPVIEALKALTTQIEDVAEAVEEVPVIELTPHQEVIQRFDRLEKKVKSVEELIIILMADL